MTSLEPDFIAELLKTGSSVKKKIEQLPRNFHLGPYNFMEKDGRCATRNCSSPTYITVEGVRRCTTHALYELNKIIMDLTLDIDFTECTCNFGRITAYSSHNPDCQLPYLHEGENLQ